MLIDFEKELIVKFSKGDDKSFDSLYVHYYPMIYRFVLGFVKDEDDSEDLSQDIFYKMWINHARFSAIESLRPYLFKMAKNAVFAHYNKEQLQSKVLASFKMKDGDEEYTFESDLYARELERIIDKALQTMSDRKQQIFRMSRYDGFSNDEIAEKLNISKRTVENTLSLVMKELGGVISFFVLLMNIK